MHIWILSLVEISNYMKSKTMFVSILASAIITISGISTLGTITNAVAQGEGDWKTYISPKFKFSIEYPSDLETHDYLSDPKGPSLAFWSFESAATSESSLLYINPNNMSLSEFVNNAL